MAASKSQSKKCKSYCALLLLGILCGAVLGYFLTLHFTANGDNLPNGLPSFLSPTVRPIVVTRPPMASADPPKPSARTDEPIVSLIREGGRELAKMRLPTSARPSHYDLLLQVFLPNYKTTFDAQLNFNYNGSVVVYFTSNQPFKMLTLNQKHLVFQQNRTVLYDNKKSFYKVAAIRLDHLMDFVVFEFGRELPAGDYHIYIPFNGKMRQPFGMPHLDGLYGSRYISREGKEQIAAVTQFEAMSARLMVPCFDEPDFKATWNVSLIHPKNTTALANQMEKDTKDYGDWKFTSYKTTPVMSSYLLAIAVMDYDYLEQATSSGIRVRVWSPPADTFKTKWTLEAAVKVIEGFEKKFGIPYPMEKIDHIAVQDFPAGAMENWGLVTYSPELFYYNPKVDVMGKKIGVAETVAHELGHMWFGNLLTTKWWSNLWLNEGFATFVQVIGLDILNENAFEGELERTEEQMTETLAYDAVRGIGYPMSYNITMDHEINEGMFSTNSYAKGSVFIDMLRSVIGSQTFEKGVSNYLKMYSYSNAWEIDLFREFDKLIAPGFHYTDPEDPSKPFNVTKWGLRWTRQKGSPVITLQPINFTHAEITQKRFYIESTGVDHPRFSPNAYEYKWDVPIFLIRADGKKEFHWLPANGRRLFVKMNGSDEAIALNENSMAIARTNYTAKGWKNLIRQLNEDHSVFSAKTRYRILSDLTLYTTMGQIDLVDFAAACGYLRHEQDRLPWIAFLQFWQDQLQSFLGNEEETPGGKFLWKLISARKNRPNITTIIEKVGQDDVEYRRNLLDIILYKKKCSIHADGCKYELNEIFTKKFYEKCKGDDKMASSCSEVPVYLREDVYCAGMMDKIDGWRDANMTSVRTMMTSLLFKEKENVELSRIVHALGCSGDFDQLEELSGKIHPPLFAKYLDSFLSHAQYRNVMPEYLMGQLRAYPNGKLKNLPRLVKLLTSRIYDMFTVNRLKEFVPEIKDLNLKNALLMACNDIERRISFIYTPKGQQLVQALKETIGQFKAAQTA